MVGLLIGVFVVFYVLWWIVGIECFFWNFDFISGGNVLLFFIFVIVVMDGVVVSFVEWLLFMFGLIVIIFCFVFF